MPNVFERGQRGFVDKPELPQLQVDKDKEGRGHLVVITGLKGLRSRACCLGCCLPGQPPQGAADLHFGLGRVPAARKAQGASGAARLP
jgi:hypothetical protein